jgi:predicted TPR repeat methyltransferase
MKPTTPDEVLDLLDAPVTSAALGAAMELGLFWLVESRPLDASGISETLGISPVRCSYWLQVLSRAGLVEEGPKGYQPSQETRAAIMNVYSQESWALLADEARGRLAGFGNLPLHLREGGSSRQAAGAEPPAYVAQMAEDPERARRFTRMLYELHRAQAEALAQRLDMSGVIRLMDMGGGSGVASIALARRHPQLTATVVDIENVCTAGREIAAENLLDDRVTYHAADFLQDELPTGFDMVLECDVNVYGEDLFRRVRKSLNDGGRFVIVDKFAPAEGVSPPSRLHWALEGSLTDPDYVFPTAALVREQLEATGFSLLSEVPLLVESGVCRRHTEGMVVIEAGS